MHGLSSFEPCDLRKIYFIYFYTLLGKEILPSRSAKDLGVIADSRLSFDEYVTEVVSKCKGSLCQINRVKHLFDRSTLITIIN